MGFRSRGKQVPSKAASIKLNIMNQEIITNTTGFQDLGHQIIYITISGNHRGPSMHLEVKIVFLIVYPDIILIILFMISKMSSFGYNTIVYLLCVDVVF